MTRTLHIVAEAPTVEGRRDVVTAVRRGFFGRCPHCGEGRMFRAYLKVAAACPVCHEDLSPQRADDAPAYVTMLIVGHFIVAGVLASEEVWPNAPLFPLAVAWSVRSGYGSVRTSGLRRLCRLRRMSPTRSQ